MRRSSRRDVLKVSGALIGGIGVGSTVTAATSTDQYIVKTKGRTLPTDVDTVHEMPGVDYAVVRGDADTLDQSRAVKDYAPDIELTLEEPDTPDELADERDLFDLPESLNDADLYDLEWDKQVQNIREAHEISRGEGTRIAIIDDGVYADHPDLDVNEALSQNFSGDDNGTGALFDDHGTHVAGTAAASDNGTGVVGTAPGAEVVDLRVFSGGTASFGAILAAIAYATAIDADVANLSLGAYPVPRQGQGSFYGGALNKTMTFANKEDTLLVIAAGNDSANLQKDKNLISLPNEGAQGLSVAATGPEGFLFGDDGFSAPPESPASYTNYGTNDIVLGAPGGDLDSSAIGEVAIPNLIGDWVLSTTFETPDDEEATDDDGDGLIDAPPSSKTARYGYKQGTSMAAPQVTGAAALVKSANPDYSANQVEAALKRAADVPDGYDKAFYGSGFVNVLDAL
jgi:subtilisin family serine protease